MMQALIDFFEVNGLIPHGFCLSWSPVLLWMNVVSDAIITLSFYSIPLMVFYFIRQRKDLPYPWLLWMTGLFIVACGTTHLLSVVTIWVPLYGLDGAIKVITAFVSLATAIGMFWVIPKLLQLPSAAELQTLIDERQKIQESLQISEMRFYMLFENMLNGIAVYESVGNGKDFVINAINHTGEAIDHVKREALLGKRFTEVFSNAPDSGLFDAMQRVFESGMPEQLSVSFGRDAPQFREYYIYRLSSGELVSVYEDVTERKGTEIALESERQFSNDIINSLPGIFYMLDAAGDFFRWNLHLQEVTGYSAEEVKVRHALDFIVESDRGLIAEKIKECFEKGSAFVRAELKTKSGASIPYYFSAKRVLLGGEVYLIGLGSDISELNRTQNALVEKENLISLARQSTPFGVWSLNLRNGELVWDDGMFDLYRLKKENFHGVYEDWRKCVHPDDIAQVEAGFHKSLEQCEPFSCEFRIVNPDGTIKHVSVRSKIFRSEDGRLDEIVGTNMDITELKKAQALAEDSARMKSRFLANMSHEIRTPMNAIIGFSQLALNLEIDPQVRGYLSKIENASQNLLQIINDILDLSKSEAGRMTLEKVHFNLNVLLNDLFALFAVQAEEKGLVFEIDVGSDVPRGLIGDQLRLQQILANLLGNAIKFTHEGQVKLVIRLKSLDPSKVRLFFSVQDTGIGMTEQERSQLFQSFNQADSSISRRFGGTGLGLVISRNLLSLMGGVFEVESVPGQGSSFSFELVLDLSTQFLAASENIPQPRKSLASLNQKLAGMRILVAEDDLTNQLVVTEFLKLSGAYSEIANNGLEVLEKLDKASFDVVLMDVHMPEMDGIEASLNIRRQPRFAKLPIIALTAGVTREERESCLASGMNDFISKPIDPNQLIAMLSNEAIAHSGHEKDAQKSIHLPGFELESLIELLDGDTDKLNKILCGFRDDFIDLLEKIEVPLATGDLPTAKRMIHTLKGAAGNIGAKRLYECSKALEAEMNSGHLTPQAFDSFSEAFKEAIGGLKRLNWAEKPVDVQAISAPCKDLLGELDQLLARHDFIEDSVLDRLQSQWPQEKMDLLTKLRKNIANILYADARAIIKQMIE